MKLRNLTVSKISFACGLDAYYGVLHSENKNLICFANISNDMRLNGFSILAKDKIKKISFHDKRSHFLTKVLKARSSTLEDDLKILPTTTLADAFDMRRGIIGIDYICRTEDELAMCYSFGYVETIVKNFVGIRFVGTEGGIDWGSLDKVKFRDIVKFEWDTGYSHAFELLHENSKSLLLKKWKLQRLV